MTASRASVVVSLSLAVLLVAASPAAASHPAGTAGDAGPTLSAGDTDPVVVQNATMSFHPDSGYVSLNVSYHVGADAVSLVTFDSPWTEVQDSRGFVQQPNGRWLWEATTDRPWLSMRLRVNRTSRQFDGYAWYDGGSWTLARPPRRFAFYSDNRSRWVNAGADTPLVRRHLQVDGPGIAGTSIAYLGNYTMHTTDSPSGRIRLVIPEAATVGTDPETVLDVLNTSASRLDVGGTNDELNVFVAPDPMRKGGLTAGVSNGTADIWIAENESVGAPANIWIHEYVHTRQHVRFGPRMRWFREASASYYAGLLSVRQGLNTSAGFDRFVRRLQRNTSDSAVLTDRSTWPHFTTPYAKGQRVLAALDARIRNETDDERTLMAVFRRMNAHNGTVSYTDFERIVTNVSRTNMSWWVETHVGSPEPVAPPRSPYAYVRPDGAGDPDGDGLSSAREYELGTNPFDSDTDGDGIADDVEAASRTDPTLADTDGDGYDDGVEAATGSNPLDPFSTPYGAVPG